MHERKETWSEANLEGRWHSFSYEKLLKRDKLGLDLFWIKDKSLTDTESLPAPDILAAEIADDLEAALAQMSGGAVSARCPLDSHCESKVSMFMHELWAGVELKLENAGFHLRQMERSLAPPDRTQHNVALEASGAIIDTGWQRSFYAHFDAFLSAVRSIPQIIKFCFGVDTHPSRKFDQLPAEEQVRRREFQRQFGPHLKAFDQLLVSTSRHISEHRTGSPQ
jgi:hypothetical protein